MRVCLFPLAFLLDRDKDGGMPNTNAKTDDDNFRGYRAPSVEAVHDQDLPKKQAKPAAKQPAARAPSVSFAPTLLQRRRSASPETSRSSSPKRVHFSPRPHSVRRRSDKPPPVLMSIKTGQQASAPRVPTPFPWDNSRRLDSLLYQLSSYIVSLESYPVSRFLSLTPARSMPMSHARP